MPSQLKVKGRVTNSVASSAPSKPNKTAVLVSPAIALNDEQPTSSGVHVGDSVGDSVGGCVGNDVGSADGAAVGAAVGENVTRSYPAHGKFDVAY